MNTGHRQVISYRLIYTDETMHTHAQATSYPDVYRITFSWVFACTASSVFDQVEDLLSDTQ